MPSESKNKSRRLAKLAFIPTYAWNLLLGRILRLRNWWDFVDDQLILGARPLRKDVARLAKLGVKSVVNLCEEYPGPTDLYAHYGIDQLWLPTIDFQPPSLEQIKQGVEYIEERRAIEHQSAENRVYVHCKAGRARSATVVLCWLMKYRNLTSEEAQSLLVKVRPHVHARLYQRDVVLQFSRELENLSQRTIKIQ